MQPLVLQVLALIVHARPRSITKALPTTSAFLFTSAIQLIGTQRGVVLLTGGRLRSVVPDVASFCNHPTSALQLNGTRRGVVLTNLERLVPYIAAGVRNL